MILKFLQIEAPDYRTKFIVKRSLRSDTGTYKITATNESGTDTADVIVTVLDRPSPPGGPVKVGVFCFYTRNLVV